MAEARAFQRSTRQSPYKMRLVIDQIRGKAVNEALALLTFSKKHAAKQIQKTLKSAVANAENNANLKVDGLVVKEAIVGEGPTMKRMMARARGSGSRILKRSSHIRIVLTDEIKIETRETRKAEQKAAKKKASERKAEGEPAKAKGERPKTRAPRKPKK